MPYADPTRDKQAKRARYLRNKARENAAGKARRLLHPGEAAAYARKRRAEYKAWINDLKIAAGCLDCGSRTGRLDFDHIDKSTKLFGLNTGHTRSRSSVLAEIEKCVVRCASCHIKRHNKERADARTRG